MTEIRKVRPSDGAEWLLGGISLLRRAPLQLGLLGLIWGGLSALASMSGQPLLGLIMALLGPILFGGLVYAVREVDAGRRAEPSHLLQGLRDGRAAPLVLTLLPQIAAMLVLALVLLMMFGSEQLQQMAQVMQQIQTRPEPDPELVRSMPTGRMFAWLVLAVIAGLFAGFFYFIAVPDIMFGRRSAFAAMGLSFRACLRNLPALVVLTVLLLIALVALSFAVKLVVVLLGWLIGANAAQFVGQLLVFAIVMPVMAGTIYRAWRQMTAHEGATAAPPALNGFEA